MFIVIICFVGLIIFHSDIEGIIVWPEFVKIMMYLLLLFFSGMGIILKKEGLFVCIFYLIVFLYLLKFAKKSSCRHAQ